MPKFSKIKTNCINEIINIIKKYNISLDEIINAYISKYQTFNENDKLLNKLQYQQFTQYKLIINDLQLPLINESKQKKMIPYIIIDDYIMV